MVVVEFTVTVRTELGGHWIPVGSVERGIELLAHVEPLSGLSFDIGAGANRLINYSHVIIQSSNPFVPMRAKCAKSQGGNYRM